MSDTTQSPSSKFEIKTERHPDLPPPVTQVGVIGWLRQNLFATWYDALMTLLAIWLLYVVVPPLASWAFVDANFLGTSQDDCTGGGACWVFIAARFNQFMFGFYEGDQQWRVVLGLTLMFSALVPMLAETVRMRLRVMLGFLVAFFVISLLTIEPFGWGALPTILAALILVYVPLLLHAVKWPHYFAQRLLYMAVALPVSLVWLFHGGPGLAEIETSDWGGLFLTLVLGAVAIGVSLPLGVMFALGRRSTMPAIRMICVGFIELFRSVPLITVLFMGSVMLPLFLPEGVNFDKVIRTLVVISLFSAAYMAEVVRGGLQAIPKGQYEAANALGLTYWKSMYLIILPQALKIVIPGIVNTFIGLFKDTTLVLIIGLFDFLGMVQLAGTNPDWLGFAVEGYVFVGFGFWIFCFGMSRYSQHLERKLHTGH